jgi:hypothetical protein
MTELSIRAYRDAGDVTEDEAPPSDAAAEARNILRNLFRDKGMSLDADPTPGDSEPVRLTEDGGYEPWNGHGFPDGYITTWTATGSPMVTDPDPLSDGFTEGDTYTVNVPAGSDTVRVRHNLGGPVTVTAYNRQGPMPYMFAQPISPDEEHVELYAGTTRLVVTREAES